MTATVVAEVSIVISAVALADVAVGLLLQARQLRAAVLQASRQTQAETARMAFDKPEIVAEIVGD